MLSSQLTALFASFVKCSATMQMVLSFEYVTRSFRLLHYPISPSWFTHIQPKSWHPGLGGISLGVSEPGSRAEY